ncbi:unnamed protein product [Arctia plantaginis]|uniref:Uncharacterized protein n=1 Tax=Arctia plantaginis TaxID=874455 RepID=A0A8S1B9Z4_ARCPL|nr:unnamed protein product [Arctia plantaginis]CAB3256385.1 unnamed protein product [Arctia plantaginis]
MALSKGSDANDEGSRLPWYTKTYWIFINIATPIAFFITIFYWIFLADIGTDGASSINLVLDLFIHLVNSLLMLALVLVSRHPVRILHFYWPVGVAIIYMIFTIIFHFAGGLSPFGTSYIYPMLNWDEPGITVVVVLGSALGLIIMQILVVIITLARDRLTRSCRGANSIPISKQGPISYNQM